ncbi:DUF4329 domain-containing protein [Sorangium sp. So ce1128]
MRLPSLCRSLSFSIAKLGEEEPSYNHPAQRESIVGDERVELRLRDPDRVRVAHAGREAVLRARELRPRARIRVEIRRAPAPEHPAVQEIVGGISLAYGYDGALPTSRTWTVTGSGAGVGSVQWIYNNDFRIVSETVSGGAATSFGYDGDGVVNQAGGLTLSRHPQSGQYTGSSIGVVSDTVTPDAYGGVQDYNFRSILLDREFAGLIYRMAGGGYSYTPAAIGGSSTSNPMKTAKHLQPGDEVVGDYHTHACYHAPTDEQFSPRDLMTADALGSSSFGYREYTSFLATPHGRIGIYRGDQKPWYSPPSSGYGVP